MLDLLINFVRNKLGHNRFLKNLFETTLRCTLREVRDAIPSITKGNLENMQHVR